MRKLLWIILAMTLAFGVFALVFWLLCKEQFEIGDFTIKST